MANGDKLTQSYTFRITPALKDMLDGLTNEEKNELNNRLRVECARAIHNSQFDPKAYLSEDK